MLLGRLHHCEKSIESVVVPGELECEAPKQMVLRITKVTLKNVAELLVEEVEGLLNDCMEDARVAKQAARDKPVLDAEAMR